MANPQAFSSVTSLMGGLRINYALPAVAQEDLGGKVAVLISAVTQLGAQLSYVQSLLTCANLSAIGFSTLSTTAFSSTPAGPGNFTST